VPRHLHGRPVASPRPSPSDWVRPPPRWASAAPGEYERLASLRDRLADRIAERIPGRVHVYGHPTRRLPNTVNLRIDGVPALQLLASTPGVAASAGSACHAGRDEPSGVLTALGLDSERALSAIRLSLGRWTGVEDVDRAVERIAAASAIIRLIRVLRG
jgi:cysteine desulfurase